MRETEKVKRYDKEGKVQKDATCLNLKMEEGAENVYGLEKLKGARKQIFP